MGPLPLLLKLSNHWLRSGCEPQSPPGTQPLASPSLWGGLQSLGVPHLFPTASPVTFCVPTSSRLPELAADFLPVPLLTTSPAPSSPQLAGSPYETRPNQNLSPFPVKPSQNIICLILMNNRHLLSPQKETGQTPPFLSFLHGFESSPGTQTQVLGSVQKAPFPAHLSYTLYLSNFFQYFISCFYSFPSISWKITLQFFLTNSFCLLHVLISHSLFLLVFKNCTFTIKPFSLYFPSGYIVPSLQSTSENSFPFL